MAAKNPKAKAIIAKATYEVQKGRAIVVTPLRSIAIFITSKESTQEKSENHPDNTLPTVLDIPEMKKCKIVFRFRNNKL